MEVGCRQRSERSQRSDRLTVALITPPHSLIALPPTTRRHRPSSIVEIPKKPFGAHT
ncbi:MAG: hypothetical protein HUU23_13895 [Caldilineales bacterium]|nr:hypothetical protein [Caldilineales bacterium]